MPRHFGPPPDDEWDPNTVALTLQPHFSGSETEHERLEIIKLHKWKYAAGDLTTKTKEQTARAHKHARTKVWGVVMAERARAIDKDVQTDKQKADIQKVEDPMAYRQSRKGNSFGPPIIPPPDKWRTDLVGESRTEKWRYVAELNDDKSAKTAGCHHKARMNIIRKFRLDEANKKDLCDRNDEDLKVIAVDVTRANLRKASNKKKQKAQQDDNKAKIKNCLVKRR